MPTISEPDGGLVEADQVANRSQRKPLPKPLPLAAQGKGCFDSRTYQPSCAIWYISTSLTTQSLRVSTCPHWILELMKTKVYEIVIPGIDFNFAPVVIFFAKLSDADLNRLPRVDRST